MWGAIIAGGMALMSGASGMSGARKQKRINEMNKMTMFTQGKEEERRLVEDIEQSESLAGALSAASGVQMSGSRAISIQDTKKSNKAQLDWLKKSNTQKVTAAAAGSSMQVSQLKTQAAMSSIKGFSQIAQGLYGNT